MIGNCGSFVIELLLVVLHCEGGVVLVHILKIKSINVEGERYLRLDKTYLT
jgi:hypothetical protein